MPEKILIPTLAPCERDRTSVVRWQPAGEPEVTMHESRAQARVYEFLARAAGAEVLTAEGRTI